VSKRHATIEYNNNNEIYLTDHNSTNGTYYNGVLITNKKPIDPPGVIQIGTLEIFVGFKEIKQESKQDKKRKSGDTAINMEVSPK